MPASAEEINLAAADLAQGGVVAFPTETFYGLAVNPSVSGALASLFALKQRDPAKPVLILIDQPSRLGELVGAVPPLYEILMARFWPGPLTLIFPARAALPAGLQDKQGTIGIRLSSHPLARKLAAAAGGMITGTSANPSDTPAAVNAEQVRGAFPTGLARILDGGQTPGGLGSTIVAETDGQLHLLRAGVLPFAEILAAVAAAEYPTLT